MHIDLPDLYLLKRLYPMYSFFLPLHNYLSGKKKFPKNYIEVLCCSKICLLFCKAPTTNRNKHQMFDEEGESKQR